MDQADQEGRQLDDRCGVPARHACLEHQVDRCERQRPDAQPFMGLVDTIEPAECRLHPLPARTQHRCAGHHHQGRHARAQADRRHAGSSSLRHCHRDQQEAERGQGAEYGSGMQAHVGNALMARPEDSGALRASQSCRGHDLTRVNNTRKAFRCGQCQRAVAYSTAMLPFMIIEWPGKLQKNWYGPPSAILLTGKLTEVVSPPPIIAECAMTRASSAFT